MKKIAIVTAYADIGGGEKNLLYIAKELSLYYDVTVFCPAGNFSNILKNNNVKVLNYRFFINRGWLLFFPLISFNFKLFFRLHFYDVIHIYSYDLVPKFFLLFYKHIILTQHGYWERITGFRKFFINFIISKVICITPDLYKNNKLIKKKIFIPLGIPIPTVMSSISMSHPVILSIGRYQYIKGQDILIDALINLDKIINYRITVYIIGAFSDNSINDHRYFEAIVNKISQHEFNNICIYLRDFTDDLSVYYSNCSFLVVPSRYESFSMVTLEALSYGKPVVVPNIGGPKYIVNDSNVASLFEPGDFISLSDAIVKMVEKHKNIDKSTCVELATNFSIANQVNNLIKVYTQLC